MNSTLTHNVRETHSSSDRAGASHHAHSIGLVDDDPAILKSLGRLLAGRGFEVTPFSCAEAFLSSPAIATLDCLVLDLSLPGKGGFEVQDQLTRKGLDVPIIFLTGDGDIPASVRAIKAGAVNFLTKPVDADELLTAITTALRESSGRKRQEKETACLKTRFTSLTARELEILRHAIAGKLNKQIAGDLGISEQTVKIHRMHITRKTGIPSIAELVRAAGEIGLTPAI